MSKWLTAKEVGERLNLEHKEVIRRIRKGDIKAKKWGWAWAIKESEVDRVRSATWYTTVMAKRQS